MQYRLDHTPKGWQLIRSPNGLPPYERVGPAWPTPEAAGRFFDREMAKHLNPSPLRTEPDPALSEAEPGTPLPARPEVVSTAPARAARRKKEAS